MTGMTFPPRRFVLTGAPGAGKTSLLATLHGRGWDVVAEAATEVIARRQAVGVAEPWTQVDFCSDILALQLLWQERPSDSTTQVFDRSPMCTLALARFLERPVSSALVGEVERLVAQRVYERTVFLVRPLGFVTPTAARRISYADSLAFQVLHEEVYREYGFELVDVPSGSVEERADLVESVVHDALLRDSSSFAAGVGGAQGDQRRSHDEKAGREQRPVEPGGQGI
jgi:predicted ATPase